MPFLTQAATLFTTVLVPILLMVGLGALVQRSQPLQMATLSRLQIYLFVPTFLFYYVYTSRLSAGQIAGIAVATLLAQFLLAVPLWLLLARRGARREGFAVVLLSSVIFNAGNFGVPVAVRAYGAAGAAVQALVVMAANLSLWAIGYGLMATITGHGPKSAIIGYLKLPMAYIILLAFGLRGFGIHLPDPVLYSVRTISDGLVPLALVTLGAQLAAQVRRPRWRVVLPVALLKLIALPIVTSFVVCLMHLWPWPGAMLIVASAGPTAVNTLLLTIEQKGDVELAAECVFWTTLLSAITVTLVLAVVTALGGHPPGT
jgi:predicted permease